MRPVRRYALTLTLDPAAFGVCEPLACRYDAAPALVNAGVAPVLEVVPAPVVVPAAVVDEVVAVAPNCTPIACSSDCSNEPNGFCVAPAVAGAAVALSESVLDCTCEPFLWPCGWILPSGSADGVDVRFVIEDT
jgi:hypothetical protein